MKRSVNKYFKNYRNNNFPEIFFLVGVFILSIGLFIEPKSSWFLGIYFYKSNLTTITTIAKILGTVIISSSLILNLKKYTSKGNNGTNGHREFLEEKKVEKEPQVDLEKLKKNLIKTGKSVSAIGWLMVIISLGVFLWSILDKNFNESGLSSTNYSTLFIIIIMYVIFIILGNRIKNVIDIKIKLYLQIILLLSLVFLIFIIYTGGTVGILFFLLTGYLISSLVQINRAMKLKSFTSTLTSPKYKLDKNGWVYFMGISVVVFMILLVIDSSTPKTDLSYESYLKEKEASSGGIYDELDKQNISMLNWIIYTSKDDNFSILFPSEPSIENLSIPANVFSNSENTSLKNSRLEEPIKGAEYFTKDANGKNTYYVNVYKFPEEFINNINPDDLLKEILMGQNPNIDGIDIYSKSGFYKQYNSIDARLDGLALSGEIKKKRIILIGNRVYDIQSYSKEYSYDEEVVNNFFNSFKPI